MKLLNADLHVKNLYVKQDPESGLIAIIAIHNTNNGPALGGCRFVSYASVDEAVLDAMSLAKAMTYKSAMAGLPLGGGKSVIIAHDGIKDRAKLFASFGQFVDTLNGTYITASDSGSNEADMKVIAGHTHHVTSINKSNDEKDDTAFMTSTGVVSAIAAAVKSKLGKDSLENIHVAIQGVGNVGYLMTKMLLAKNAKVTLTDINADVLAKRAKELGVNTVTPEEIFSLDCDVFAPCALGGVINEKTLNQIKAPIICGAANNQLSNLQIGQLIQDMHKLYIPDYVANAGGVICAAAQAGVISREDSYKKVEAIYDTVLEVAEISKQTGQPTGVVANRMAEERFALSA